VANSGGTRVAPRPPFLLCPCAIVRLTAPAGIRNGESRRPHLCTHSHGPWVRGSGFILGSVFLKEEFSGSPAACFVSRREKIACEEVYKTTTTTTQR
jgi:hypothetical protein